jgi:2-dehydropantoate 2-reductase
VLGAGAIGAYVGAALARGGADVVLIARGAHLRAMQQSGVRVLSARGDFDMRVEATDDLAALSGADVVLLGVKAYSLPEVAEAVAAQLGPETAVMAAQNGLPWWYFQGHDGPLADMVLESVDPGGVLSSAFEPSRVVGCVVYPAAEIVEPGVIRHVEGTRLAIGEPDGSLSERCTAIAEALRAGGLKCNLEAALRNEIWLKLIGNAAFNPVSALCGATLGELATRPETVELLRGMMSESAAVAGALGVKLRVGVERRLEAGLAVGDHKTSMLQDLEAGKRLELDCMTGAIIELADRLGLETPRTKSVDACLRLVESLRWPDPAPQPAVAAGQR